MALQAVFKSVSARTSKRVCGGRSSAPLSLAGGCARLSAQGIEAGHLVASHPEQNKGQVGRLPMGKEEHFLRDPAGGQGYLNQLLTLGKAVMGGKGVGLPARGCSSQ